MSTATRQSFTSQSAPATRQRLEATLHQRWFALTQADMQGQPTATLERLFAAYMAALEAVVAANQKQAKPK